MDVNSTNTETLNNLGSVNQCMGNIEKALDYYLQVIALAPQAEFARKCALFAILNHSNVSSIELYKFHLDLRAIRPSIPETGDILRDGRRGSEGKSHANKYRLHVRDPSGPPRASQAQAIRQNSLEND